MTYLELFAKLSKEMAENPGLSVQRVQFSVDNDDLYEVTDVRVTKEDETFDDGSKASEGTLLLSV
jgi:hypothetical protein